MSVSSSRLLRWCIRATVALAALPLILASCGGSSSSSPTEPPQGPPASLRGTVTLSGSTTPVAGVTVRTETSSPFTTANDGQYLLGGLVAGSTRVFANRDGFVAATITTTLAAGDNVLDLELTPESMASCADLGGAWTGSWTMSCAGSGGQSAVNVAQTDCFVTIPVAGLGTFSGPLVGDESDPNLVLQFEATAPGSDDPSCSPESVGGLTFDSMTGEVEIFFGDAPPPCCQHGFVTLDR